MAQRTNEAKWIASRNRWQLNIQKDGKRKTFTSSKEGSKGKISCERKADKWIEKNTIQTNIRFGKAFKEFIEQSRLLTSNVNADTYEKYGRIYLFPTLEHKKISSLTKRDYQECINLAFKKGLSKKTLSNIRGTLTAFYDYIETTGYEMSEPTKLAIPKKAIEKEKIILQPDKLKLLFSNDVFHKNIHAFRFAVLTGLRPGELCGLQWKDIDDGILYVKRGVSDKGEITAGKNQNAIRYFALTKQSKKVLADQKQHLKNISIISPFVFPMPSGSFFTPPKLYSQWYSFRKKHDIEASLYELRHTFVSINKADVPEQLLKQIAGHSNSMDTFGVYGHIVDGETERTGNIIEGVFDKLLD